MSGAPRSRGAAAALAAQKAKEAASSAAASKDRRAGSSGSYPDYAPGEGEAVESPHREQQYAGVGSDADRGDPLFRSGGRGAPAPQPPAPTPAPFTGGFICPPNAIPEEFRDHAEAYEVGYAEGRFSDSTFAQVWEANARWEYNRGAVLKGFLTGRNGRPPPPQTWPRASLDGLATPAGAGDVAARRQSVLQLTIAHYFAKAKEGALSEWLRDFVQCRVKVIVIGGAIVLNLKHYFFADDETLKSIGSHFLLREFGEAYDDNLFAEAWDKGIAIPVRKRKHASENALDTRQETLRTLLKRLYNTARTNLFTLCILKTFRQEAGLGAKPPGKQNVAGAAKAKISDAEGDAYRKAQLGALSPFPLPLCVIYTILLVLRGQLAKDRNAKYGMPWLAGPYNTTPALDKSSDPWGSDAAVNTLCRVWGLDPSGVSESIEVTQLQCAIVASTLNDWIKGVCRSAVSGSGSTDQQIKETISFFRTAYETNGWKTAADEPLTKRITIVDYPTVAYTFSPYDAAPPVATRAILDKLDSYESVDAPATGAVGE